MVEGVSVLLCTRGLCGRTDRFRASADVPDGQSVPIHRDCGTAGYSGNLGYIDGAVFGIVHDDSACMRQISPREHCSNRYTLGNSLWNVLPADELIRLLLGRWGRGRGRFPSLLDVRGTENDLIIAYSETGAVVHIIIILCRSAQRHRTIVGIIRYECYPELLDSEIRGYGNIGRDGARCIRP